MKTNSEFLIQKTKRKQNAEEVSRKNVAENPNEKMRIAIHKIIPTIVTNSYNHCY